MTAPNPQAVGTGVTGGSGATLSPAWPAHLTNDIGILLCVNSYNTTTTPATPSGWTQIGTKTASAGGVNLVATAWWKRAASGAEAAPGVVTPATDPSCAAVIYTYRGCITTGTPYEASNSDGSGPGTFPSLTTTALGGTTTGADRLVVNLFALFLGGPTGGGSITGATNASVTLSEQADTTHAVGGETVGLAAATGTLAAASSFGTTSASVSASTYAAWGTFTIALIPPVASTEGDAAITLGTLTSSATGVAAFDGYGGEGAATFVLPVDGGSSVRFEWGTTILPQRADGRERRTSWRPRPRVSYKFSMLVDDVNMRELRRVLIEEAANASTFLVGLPYEELRLRADASGVVVAVFGAPLGLTDWAIVSQRVVVRAADGATVPGVIQAVGADTITLAAAPGIVGKGGGSIMPAMEVHLDGTQGFDRFVVNRERWELNAIGLQPGFVGQVASIGTGATLATLTGIDGSTIPIFDRGIIVDGTNATSVIPTAARVDLGYLVRMIATQNVAGFGRQVLYKRSGRAEWQWLKKFLFTARGMQRRFLLPTGRPDLVATAIAGSVLTVSSTAGYAARWYPISTAHRYVSIVYRNGTIDYRRVDDAVNAGAVDNLTLSSAPSGVFANVVRVSLMELCRFDSDAIEIPWTSGTFTFNQTARVVLQ